MRELVQAKLELDWSPEQIAAWLRTTRPDRPDWQVCHQTIYQALYRGGRGGLSRQLTRRLRTERPLRKRRRRAAERSPRFIAPGLLLEHRSRTADERDRVGDWEGDLIVGRMSQSEIGTLVDRCSRYVRLVHLPDGHRADQLLSAISPVLQSLPDIARWTLTWDQGSEMARHDDIAGFLARASSSRRPVLHGCAGPTRTRTVFCASTSPRAQTCDCTRWRTCAPSRNASTTAPGRSSAGRHPRRCSLPT